MLANTRIAALWAQVASKYICTWISLGKEEAREFELWNENADDTLDDGPLNSTAPEAPFSALEGVREMFSVKSLSTRRALLNSLLNIDVQSHGSTVHCIP